MKRGRAQVVWQIVACLDERNRNAFIHQQIGGDEADGPGTDDDHVLPDFGWHGVP